MNRLSKKLANHLLRKMRIRDRVIGTADRPRLSVFISNQHVSAQVIDDQQHATLVSSTTVANSANTLTSKTAKAAWIGADIAKKAKKAGIQRVVLDRSGRQYKGRLQALADAARREGLEF